MTEEKAVEEARRMDGVGLIAAERRRQVEAEGYTAVHDDEHGQRPVALAKAGAAYALASFGSLQASALWPFESGSFKPRGGIADLVRAGALIAAEIDRLQRLEERRASGN